MTALPEDLDLRSDPTERVRPSAADPNRRSTTGSPFSPFAPLASLPMDERTLAFPVIVAEPRRLPVAVYVVGAIILAALISVSLYIGVEIGTERALAAATRRAALAPAPVPTTLPAPTQTASAAPLTPVPPPPAPAPAADPAASSSPSADPAQTVAASAPAPKERKKARARAKPKAEPEEDPWDLPPLPKPQVRRPFPQVLTAPPEVLPPTPVLTMDPYRPRGPQYVIVQPLIPGAVEVVSEQIR